MHSYNVAYTRDRSSDRSVSSFTFPTYTSSEAVVRTSVGKHLFAARIVRIDGSRPGLGAVLLRNLFKLLVLLVPPLAVFALFNRDLQLPGDVVTRTVVVREAAEPEA